MTWTPESGCQGKVGYLSKPEAKRMSRAVSSKNVLYGGSPTHIYKCPARDCGLYHVGHPIGTRSEVA